MMNLYHLRYFWDAARLGSLSEAAKLHRMSQSAVSQAIRALEKQFECELLIHQKKHFYLTEAGKTAYAQCPDLFQSVERLNQTLSAHQKEYLGELSIGCTTSIGMNLLAEPLARLQKLHPGIYLKIKLGNSEVIGRWLEAREIDLGIFVTDTPRAGDYDGLELFTGHYVLVHAPGLKKARLAHDGIIVTRHDRPEVRHLQSKFKAQYKSALKVKMEVVGWEFIKSLALQGAGFGLCADYVVRKEIADGSLSALRLGFQEYPYQVQAWSIKNRVLPKNAKLLVDLLRNKTPRAHAK